MIYDIPIYIEAPYWNTPSIGGSGSAQTLNPNTDDKQSKNPMGFIWTAKKSESIIIAKR